MRDPRISYLRNPNSTGGIPSIVRNLAWPNAQGRFVHFLDDDDIVPGGHYAAVKATFAHRLDVGLVFGQVEAFGDCPDAQLRHEQRFFVRAARRAAMCGRFGRKLAFAGQMLFDLPLLVCSAGWCGANASRASDRLALKYRIGFPSLMHATDPPPGPLRLQREGRERMRAKYHREYGTFEFYGPLRGMGRDGPPTPDQVSPVWSFQETTKFSNGM